MRRTGALGARPWLLALLIAIAIVVPGSAVGTTAMMTRGGSDPGARLDGVLPALDRDTTFDRAVGPMQFIPSTWREVGQEANGDGRRDPDNLFDAALGAAVCLCAGDADLRLPEQQAQAVRRYNNADEYVRVVLNLAAMYESGRVDMLPPIGMPPREPIPPPRPSPFPPSPPPLPPPSSGGPGSPTPSPASPSSPPAVTPGPPPPAPSRPPATPTPLPAPPTTVAPTTTPSTTVPPTPSTTVPPHGAPVVGEQDPDTAAVGWAPAMREVVVEILEEQAPPP